MRSHLLAMVGVLTICVAAGAEDPVYFPDARMKAAVEEALWVVDPTPTDMLNLTSLESSGGWDRKSMITSLTGLEYAVNLQSLTLHYHDVGDLSPLSGLKELTSLAIQASFVHNVSPLSGLTNLRNLNLEGNEVTDVSALSSLTNVSQLSLHRNPVSDISPLVSMTSLTWVDLRGAVLDRDAYDTYIPQLIASRPGIQIVYDSYLYEPRTVVVECGPGGVVTAPGEGQFSYDYGQLVCLRAQADPCFVFSGWSGSYSGAQNPAYVTISQNHQIKASFVSLLDRLYVDDDAPDDPGPDDPQRSDPLEDGTETHPFDCVQEAIDVAAGGTSIIVRPGTYREDINLLGKKIFVAAIDPADPCAGPCAVIEGSGDGPVVRISAGGGTQCGLSGFVVTGGKGAPAGAIYCSGSSPRLSHCLIVGNRCLSSEGAAVYFCESRAVLTHCTIAGNYAGPDGAGLTLIDSDIEMTDSILWDNKPTEIRAAGTSDPTILYCCVRGWWPDIGNIHANPLFARSGAWVSETDPNTIVGGADSQAVWLDGDYHARSQAGRWDLTLGQWVHDDATSPCIDAGDPASEVGAEPSPNGGRVNMGVYGGTSQASLSPTGL